MKFIVGNLYQCIYDINVHFVPLMVLPTLEDARKYYYTDGFFSTEFEELKYDDLVVILDNPLEIDKNWGYIKILTASGFIGWLLTQDNDFKEAKQNAIMK